ncbi:chemotaxis protein CheW [Methanofollis aquaemaris]|uniref:Chemotaxis protein CheW n=1 Tax=Methanofollis aquaemaris TaxID=126734 RepID=A0A8A3S6K6_9EURY|nr:chemotaxis protein CheW [Methanofollis aquaemaris]QSZ67563.1 chemotaxis protein CheW [Methanofollis aquaemaris]
MAQIDVVEFEVAEERYALDISLAREIVEMVPITPVPRSPPHIAGIINLRGEITTVMALSTILGIPRSREQERQKIIILVSEAAGGANVGVIVDDVLSVMQISEEEVETVDESLSRDAHVKGIIKVTEKSQERDESAGKKNLIIWVDMEKILEEITGIST